MGKCAPRRAGRPDLRRRTALSATASLRPGTGQAGADRLRRLLPLVRTAARRAGRRRGRPARRRWEPGDLEPRRRAQPHRLRGAGRPRALRLVPPAAGTGPSRGRLPADPRDRLRRRVRRPLPAGVVCRTSCGRPRQLRPHRRRRAPGGGPRAPAADRRQDAHLPHSARHDANAVRRLAERPPPRPHVPRHRGPLRRRPRLGCRVLEPAARRRDTDRRARTAGQRRAPQPADPEPDAHLALLDRKPVRAVLVPGGLRCRAGAGRVRPRRCLALDPAHLADAEADAVPELEAGREARRLRGALPPLGRPDLHQAGDSGSAQLRQRARAPDRPQRHGPARPRAVLLRHPGLRARAAFPGRRLAGPAGDGARVGRDREHGARQPLPRACRTPGARAPPSGPRIAGPAGGRLALPPCAAARRRASVRLAHGGPAGQLLEPGHALRARLGALQARQPGGAWRAALSPRPRLARARSRARRSLRALPEPVVPDRRHRRGLRDQRRPLPRRREPARPARPEPLRNARRPP